MVTIHIKLVCRQKGVAQVAKLGVRFMAQRPFNLECHKLERMIPYSGKIWQAMYLEKWPILPFGEFYIWRIAHNYDVIVGLIV